MSSRLKKRYKLTDENLKTLGPFNWTVGKLYTLKEQDNYRLCSPDVFHFYDNPITAAILNRSHSNLASPRLWEVQCEEVVHNGFKGGARRMKLIREVPLPIITLKEEFEITLKLKLVFYNNKPDWNEWAENWLLGTDISIQAAEKAREKQDSYLVEYCLCSLVMNNFSLLLTRNNGPLSMLETTQLLPNAEKIRKVRRYLNFMSKKILAQIEKGA